MSDEPVDVGLAVRQSRRHRELLPEPVDEALLERLVSAARRAPTSRDDLRRLVVTADPRVITSIRQVCPGWVTDAPAMLAVCADTRLADDVLGASAGQATALDSGAAAAHASLAAPALGLDTRVVTSWPKESVQGVLNLPDHIRPDVLLAVGRPVVTPATLGPASADCPPRPLRGRGARMKVTDDPRDSVFGLVCYLISCARLIDEASRDGSKDVLVGVSRLIASSAEDDPVLQEWKRSIDENVFKMALAYPAYVEWLSELTRIAGGETAARNLRSGANVGNRPTAARRWSTGRNPGCKPSATESIPEQRAALYD